MTYVPEWQLEARERFEQTSLAVEVALHAAAQAIAAAQDAVAAEAFALTPEAYRCRLEWVLQETESGSIDRRFPPSIACRLR